MRSAGATVRCPSCPGHPVLAAAVDTDTRKCVRCQGDHRWLPVPHPDDHLCEICRSECPQCRAPAGRGKAGLCLACRGLCRSCGEPLPDRSDQPVKREAAQPATPSGKRQPRQLYFFPSSWKRDLCDACQDPQHIPAEQRVARALPTKIIRACGGTAPAAAMQLIRSELQQRTAQQLIERIERRWWGGWSNRPLSHPGSDGLEAYGPDNVVVWLLSPTDCPARCEDGWSPHNPDQPCLTCQPIQPYRATTQPLGPAGQDAAATARSILRTAQTPAARGEYVPPAATRTAEQEAEHIRSRLEQDRTQPTSRQRRTEISADDEKRDPVWVAAVKKAREERKNGERPR